MVLFICACEAVSSKSSKLYNSLERLISLLQQLTTIKKAVRKTQEKIIDHFPDLANRLGFLRRRLGYCLEPPGLSSNGIFNAYG